MGTETPGDPEFTPRVSPALQQDASGVNWGTGGGNEPSVFALFQNGLQVFLVVVAVLSVPVLLLGKPFYLNWLHHGNNHLRMYRVRAGRCE